ncbi:MAG: hypothetical protein UY96_C0017G0070 [Parcubacteria group bacterium GW2011_GWB1_56_8]|nr:MAG: hypothetical protein UY96_C0017G0070 [Parcubacteria group bacterium GW2011_GWB1_56_8]
MTPNLTHAARLRDSCIDAAATIFGVTPYAIHRGRKHREIVLARHAIIYSLCEEAKFSLVKIGKLMKRDHTSIMAARDKAEQRLEGVLDEDGATTKKFALAVGACRRVVRKAIQEGQPCPACEGTGRVFMEDANGKET